MEKSKHEWRCISKSQVIFRLAMLAYWRVHPRSRKMTVGCEIKKKGALIEEPFSEAILDFAGVYFCVVSVGGVTLRLMSCKDPIIRTKAHEEIQSIHTSVFPVSLLQTWGRKWNLQIPGWKEPPKQSLLEGIISKKKADRDARAVEASTRRMEVLKYRP